MERKVFSIIGIRHVLPAVLASLVLVACGNEHDGQAAEDAAPIAEDAAPIAEPAPEQADAAPEPPAINGVVANLGRAPVYQGNLSSLSLVNVRNAVLAQVVPPIVYPWAFEFIDDDEILLTQNPGILSRINLTTGTATEISGLPDIGEGFAQIGLMDVVLHPDFANNRRIYISFAKPMPEAPKYHMTEVATGVLEGDQLTQVETLINGEGYGWAPSNFGGALAFDNDGHLYITIGDRGEDTIARKGDRLESKMLRLNADGSVPEDNPFVGREGYDPRVYAIGLRNSQGLHYDEQLDLMIASDHGPLGGDEINIIRPGLDYGWAASSYGANYTTAQPIGNRHMEGIEQPIFYFLPSIAASPLVMYRGEMFSEWDGHILVGALRGEHIAKLDFNEGVVRSEQAILGEVGGRIRDIKVADDGSIYILSQTTGLHRLFRPEPEPEPPQALSSNTTTPADEAAEPEASPAESAPPAVHPGQQYYLLVCSGCHDSGALDAPVMGDYAQWQPIIEQPLELTREHVLNGYNDMPARGFCYVCSDFGLMQMVDYMFEEAKKNAE